MKKLTVAVDLDGCLAEAGEWLGREHVGEPLPFACEAMWQLVNDGHEVIVFSCRTSNEKHPDFSDDTDAEANAEIIRAWLNRHGFPVVYMQIWTGHGKPFADVYCDDRALHVEPVGEAGLDWEEALIEIDLRAG